MKCMHTLISCLLLLVLSQAYGEVQNNDYFQRGRPLYKAARNGKWKDVAEICDRNAGCAFITEGHETALHISTLAGNVEFVRQLLPVLQPGDLLIVNKKGNTALVLAAANGNVEIARLLINRSDGLQNFIGTDSDGTAASLPIIMAARLGNGEMVEELRGSTRLTDEQRGELLMDCIDSDLFDSARKILEGRQQLAVSDTGVLKKLVTKPMAERTKKRICETIFCWGRKQEDSLQIQALELLQDILKLVFTITPNGHRLSIWSTVEIAGELFFDAAEQGNFHFIKCLIYYYPEIVWKMNSDNLSMFHVAVKFRHEKIFTLLHNMDEVRKLVTTYQEKHSCNNMLHLAATLAPKEKRDAVNGAAFQMQRAICWYKAVEKIVPPAYRNMPNRSGSTPADIFDKKHKILLEEGEKWMRDTAKSCMVVAALTATVMFSSAFTVPGDYDDKGHPHLLNRASFDFLTVSEVIGMLSSSTSILMFLSILTSRFNKYAFRHSLPCKLMIGIVALFVSIASMVMAFCTAIYLSYGHSWLLWLLFSLAGVPILVLCLRFRLLFDIIRATWVSRYMFKSTKLSDY